ncbi:hypothetical protein ACFLSA_04465 [Bacteroidota bacterium]
MIHIKNKVICILILLLLSACSAQKMLQKGRYDEAIEKAIKKIRKNDNNQKAIEVLDKAYRISNEKDMERIRFLQQEGKADNWEEILYHYSTLKRRQSLVRTVLPLNLKGRNINYSYIDYNQQIIEAKQNAAEYFYTHGQELMNMGDKESYRLAYEEFQKVKNYSSEYGDIERLIREAETMGISRVLLQIENRTHLNLPEEYLNDLVTINTSLINSKWVEYHTRLVNEDVFYDYTVHVILKSIAVSPDKVTEKDHVIKKEVEDGFEYVLDDDGNVMKDTAGNDIKVTKYKTLQCTVIEKIQHKVAMVSGAIEFYSNSEKKLMKTDPFKTETVFNHQSARAIGDEEALDDEMAKLIKRKEIPFPDDFDLIFQTTDHVRNAVRNSLVVNKRLLR